MSQQPLLATRIVVLVVGLIGLTCAHARAQPAASYALGTNLTEVTDYSHQIPFNDIFRFSRSWITQCRAGVDPGCSASLAFDTGEADQIDLDQNSWVKSLPSPSNQVLFTRVATYWDIPSDFPSGPYVVLYDGEGVIEYELGARKNTDSSTPGRDVVDVTPANGGILLRISATNPNNYIRNIRMVLQSSEALLGTQTFSSRFLTRLQPFQTLRFMDWMRTNNSNLTTWENRAQTTDARYSTEKGVPAEIMIDLCNSTGKAPWFTMPHKATDSFVAAFAALTKSLLLPALPVYVEYSNEAWNSVFSQGSFMEQEAELEWPLSPESSFTKRINWYGKRSAQVCDIWKQAFADTPSRVVCVMASQAANSWTAEQALTCPLWENAPCVQHGISALAIAPYFGDYIGQEDSQSSVLSWMNQGDGGLGTLFTELTSGGELPGGPGGGAITQSHSWISENKIVANEHALSLLAYEGGQHLVAVGSASNNSSLTSLFTSANRDLRMGALYSSYLQGWHSRGGGLFMHFNDVSEYSRFGSWGALEGTAETSSPKYDALVRYASGDSSVPPFPSPSATATATPQERRLLTLRLRGAGSVTSTPAAVACSQGCTVAFNAATRVTLRAKPRRGSAFIRWGGACRSSRRTCSIEMTRNRRVSAVFSESPKR
jgi:hypothetical protein